MGLDTEYIEPITIANFDEGIMLSLGGEIKDIIIDGEAQRVYRIKFPGLTSFSGVENADEPWVDCFFISPEQVLAKYILPCVVIRREDPVFASIRWLPFTKGYRTNAEGARKIGNGYDLYKQRTVPYPFDLPYSIQLLARYQEDALLMLRQCLQRIDPRGWVTVKVGDEVRTYDCLLEGISDISELADVAGRVSGYAVAVRVIGELDLANDYTERAVLYPPIISIQRKDRGL